MVFILWNQKSLFSQNTVTKSTTEYSVNTSFSEFHEIEAAVFTESEFNKLKEIVKLHLRKAKNQNEPIEVARAYYYLILTEEPQQSIILHRFHDRGY